MLPRLECGDLGVDGLCCETWWNQANHLLGIVATDLIECLPKSACCSSDFTVYVSHGIPSTWQGDYLAIWLAGMAPSVRSSTNIQTITQPTQLLRLNWVMRLCESGYPMIATDVTGVPDVPGFDEMHYINRYVYSHGEQMLRSIIKACNNGTLTPQGPSGFVFGSCQPLLTERGTAGFEMSFSTDANWKA